ncbi:hypothetical protein CRG98_035403 [Punica granatum]|nr:hypothetical protein CRG98_035403 [Punica granatum]
METESQNSVANSVSSSSTADSMLLDSTAQAGEINIGTDWQEEIYQKIISLKELYLQDLNEMYHKIARKLQQQQDDSLPQQLTPEVLEKMRTLQEILEYHINILQIPKSEIHPGLKDKLPSYERRILIFVNSNRSIRQRGLN